MSNILFKYAKLSKIRLKSVKTSYVIESLLSLIVKNNEKEDEIINNLKNTTTSEFPA